MKPIELTLYDPQTGEPKKTYTRSFVPWAILKKAIRLQKSLDASEITDEALDELAALVVATFGDQFSLADVTDGADVGEMTKVIQEVIGRASQFVAGKGPGENPTPAAK